MCLASHTTDAFAGGTSVWNATGSLFSRSRPSCVRSSNLYFAPSSTPGTNSSQIPEEPSERIGCRRPSHELKSPTTATERAFGAQTANAVPTTPSMSRTCAPSRSYSRSWRPSIARCRSSSPSVGRNAYGSRSVYVLPSGYATSSSYSSGRLASGSSASQSPAGSVSSAATPAGRTRTELASGRQTRTTTPPSSSCAPRTPWGLAPSSITSRRLRRVLHEPLYPGHRDANPVGPVVQLVAQLVDRLFQLEHRQQALDRRLARRQQRRVDRLEVGVEEADAGALLPVLGRLAAAVESDRGGGVRERAQHPGDVAERRALAPALDERPRRLALEVDDHPVVAGEEGLAEVVVAVR